MLIRLLPHAVAAVGCRWRTWSLHNRKNSALKDVTFAHSESPGDTLRISSDALSVSEGRLSEGGLDGADR